MTKDLFRAHLFRPDSTRGSINRGWTLIEVLVVIGIIVLLIAISLPAIQMVRESSRRTTCAGKLRQLGIASQNFESNTQRLPSADWVRELMPMLELNQDEIKIQFGRGEITNGLDVLSCASDTGAADPKRSLYSNFLGNAGVWGPLKKLIGPIEIVEFGNGGANDEWIRSSSITDGHSNTALFAETLRGGSERLRGVWALPGHTYSESEFDDFIAACLSLPADPINQGFLGDTWAKGAFLERTAPTAPEPEAYFIAGMSLTMYNHALPPQNPSCFNGSAVFSAAITATSSHPSTVNIVFCDGHVSSVSPSIAVKVWQSQGSRSGGDSE